LIVDSGGGYQAWWQLAEPLPATSENVALVEGIGRTLQNRYGGDSIWDVSRIMRLPGTINVPGPEKAAQGRTPALASVLPLSTGLPVTLEAFRAWAPPSAAPRAQRDARLPEIELPEADHYDELPSALRQKFEAARNRDAALDRLWNGTQAPEQTDTSHPDTLSLWPAVSGAPAISPQANSARYSPFGNIGPKKSLMRATLLAHGLTTWPPPAQLASTA